MRAVGTAGSAATQCGGGPSVTWNRPAGAGRPGGSTGGAPGQRRAMEAVGERASVRSTRDGQLPDGEAAGDPLGAADGLADPEGAGVMAGIGGLLGTCPALGHASGTSRP
jgi:hypothetical protein